MNLNNTLTQRQCSICKDIKPLNCENFHKEKSKTGFSYTCKKCKNKSSEAKKQRDKERYLKNKIPFIISSYKKFDKKKGFLNDIDYTFIQSSLLLDCVYCGFPSVGLDRLDNKKGHTLENCVPACKECNIARMDNFTHEDMLIIGKSIREVKLKRI